MKETDDAGCRSIMNEARKMARNTMETIEKSNHEMGEQVKHDIQALEDEVEHYFKNKKHEYTPSLWRRHQYLQSKQNNKRKINATR